MYTNLLKLVFLFVDPCLFKLDCLTDVRSKFIKEKTLIFTFSLYLVLPVQHLHFHYILFFQFKLIDDQPNAVFQTYVLIVFAYRKFYSR